MSRRQTASHQGHPGESRALISYRERLRPRLEDWSLLANQLNSHDTGQCHHATASLFLSLPSLESLTREFLGCLRYRSCETTRYGEINASLDELRHLSRGWRRSHRRDSAAGMTRQIRVAAEDLVLLLSEELLRNERFVPHVPATGEGKPLQAKPPKPNLARPRLPRLRAHQAS
jgi:hypothetical protein